MNILFVCSGNSPKFDISPFINAQAESLRKLGHTIDYYLIKGKGIGGYISNIPKLKSFINKGNYDIIHAHYSFCGVVSSLSTKKRVVCSLMGSDVKESGLWRLLIRYFIKHKWQKTIAKSEDMKKELGIDKIVVIPNGVDLEIFKPLDKNECRKKIGWKQDGKIVLFGADPNRTVKNFSLAKSSYNMLIERDPKLISMKIELITLGSIAHEIIPLYLNACDVLLLTSKWEGSPNIIKEAKACNIPIVCTDVGDVRWLLDGVDGCYITSQNPNDIADKLHRALSFNKRTTGREKLIQLGLDSTIIAQRIIEIYENVLNK